MKLLHIIGLGLALLACSSAGFAQNTQRPTRQRASETVTDNMPGLTERARIKNEVASKAPEHIVWLREMYRIIDLENENNAALYFPVQPMGDRMNLFTTIFKLLADGKITAYNYLMDRQEVFVESEKLDFEEFLKKFGVLYTKQGTGDNVRFIVDDIDIPSYQVSQYQIKEGWYFDAATGTYRSQVTAICPLLVRTEYDTGSKSINPVCWIPYENLRPYLSRTMIMTSDYNNVMTNSIDDFFTKGMYTGDIFKTVNMRDLTLMQQVGDDPEMLKLAQDSIENQLSAFREQLWIRPDTTQVADSKSNKKAPAVKEAKPKVEKSSAPASPTRSVRRTR